MKIQSALNSLLLLSASLLATPVLAGPTFGLETANGSGKAAQGRAHRQIGAVKVSTLPLPEGVIPQSAAFTPSGKLLLNYSDENGGPGVVQLATLNDDGS